jgi:hypothetical protein
VIGAQCDAPDSSVIELTFRNATQFKAEGLSVFCVRFENGKAVSIDRARAIDDQSIHEWRGCRLLLPANAADAGK